jgi:amino-acid N-acetyltransferase
MTIEPATNERESIAATLSAEKLPADDLPATMDNFFMALENGQLTGVIGLEIYGAYGLLRSLAVLPEFRKRGVAGELIGRLENHAAAKGLEALYLLTETAPVYFLKKGFTKIGRDDVPDEVKQSSEFSHVCPVSAIVMKKSIS